MEDRWSRYRINKEESNKATAIWGDATGILFSLRCANKPVEGLEGTAKGASKDFGPLHSAGEERTVRSEDGNACLRCSRGLFDAKIKGMEIDVGSRLKAVAESAQQNVTEVVQTVDAFFRALEAVDRIN